MGVANKFNTKIINDEIEDCGASDMSEKARCMPSWMVAVVGKVLDEFDVRKTSRLWEAVHSGANFDKYAVFVDEWFEIIFLHNVGWNCPSGDP